MDIPSTYARSYRIVLPNSNPSGTVSPTKKSSFSSTLSEPLSLSGLYPSSSSSSSPFPYPQNTTTHSSFSYPVHRPSVATQASPNSTTNSPSSLSSPSRKLSDREPLPFPPPSFPRVISSSVIDNGNDDDDDSSSENDHDQRSPHPLSSSSSATPFPTGSPRPNNTSGGFGFLSPLGNDSSTVISTADSALDLHAEIASAVQRAVAAHNSSWQATLAAAENEWMRNKDEAIQRLTQSKDEIYQRDKTKWEKERKDLVTNYENQIKTLQQQLQRAVNDREEEARKTGTLTTMMEQIRAESIPLASHKAELLGLELQLKAREKSTEETVKTMRATQDQAIARATVLVRMSEDRLMVAIAAREAELKDTVDKMREEYTNEIEKMRINHTNEVHELETRLRKEAEEALTAEQNAHASTKSALARMRGKATMVRAVAHLHSVTGSKNNSTPPLTTSSSPIPFMANSPSSTANSPSTKDNLVNNSSPGSASPLNTSETNSSGFFSPVGIIPNNVSLSSMKKELSRSNSVLNKDNASASPSLVGRILSSSSKDNNDQETDGFEILPSNDTLSSSSSASSAATDDNARLNLAPVLDVPNADTKSTEEDAEHAEHDRLLDELHEKVDQLGAQLNTLNQEHTALQNDYHTLQDELQTVRTERNDYEDSFRDFKAKYENIFDTLTVTKHQLQETNDTNESLSTTVDQLSNDIANARNENDILHEEVIRLRPAAAQGVVDHEQAVKLREQLALALLALSTDIAVQLPGKNANSSIENENKDDSMSSLIHQGNMNIIPPFNPLRPLTDELQKVMKTVDYSTKTVEDTVSTHQNTVTDETKTDNQATLTINSKVSATSFVPELSMNIQQYAENRLPSYPSVLEALKQLFVLGNEVNVRTDGNTVTTPVSASGETDGDKDKFSDDGDDGDDDNDNSGDKKDDASLKPPLDAAKAALEFVNAMLQATENTVERYNNLNKESTLSPISGYSLPSSSSTNEPLPPLPLILPEVNFNLLFKDLAFQRYSGILTILASFTKPSVEDMDKKEAWVGLLPAARALLSFLAILADTTSTPKDVIELLQMALDDIPRRETEAQRQAVATTFGNNSTAVMKNTDTPSARTPISSSSSSSSDANDDIVKFDADLADQLISTADQLRHAAVAAERRHGLALADAALVRESTAVALIRAHTYIQGRDNQCTTVLQTLHTVYDMYQSIQERTGGIENTLQAIHDYVRHLQTVRQDDQKVFSQTKDEWSNQLGIYRGILTKLASEIEALTLFETSRAPFIMNRNGTSSSSGILPSTSSVSPNARNPLQHLGAASLLMSATHRAAQKAKTAVARKHADDEEKELTKKAENETKALAESQIKILQDALNSTPPLPSSPQVTGYGNNDPYGTPQIPNTPNTTPNYTTTNTVMTPAPPTPYNLRMNNNLFYGSNNHPNDIESSVDDTGNMIRLRSDLLVANTSSPAVNPLASPAVAALSSFVNNSPRLPPATPTSTIKLNHPLPLPILGVVSASPSSTTKPSRAPPGIPSSSSLSSPVAKGSTGSNPPRDRFAGGIGTTIPYSNFGESLSSEIVRKAKDLMNK